MKIAVYGGTGFVGSYLIDGLVGAGHQPVVLVRKGSEHKLNHADECTIVSGDIEDSAAVAATLDGADAAIYAIGILREFPRKGITFKGLHYDSACRVIDAAQAAAIKRFLLMSANGVMPDGTAYQRTKYQAEQYLNATDLHWTIFRPSVIFGDPRGRMEFASQLYRDVIASPLPAPLFFPGLLPTGAGSYEFSPVHVENVARAFVTCLDRSDCIGRILQLGGEEVLSWRDILHRLAAATGRRKVMLPVPALGIDIAARLLQQFDDFPITHDQITMLVQGNTCSADDLVGLGIRPLAFDSENLAYLQNIGISGAR